MAVADRPISVVLRDIVGNMQDIVRSEMRLAKTEVTDDLEKMRAGAVLTGIGVLMLLLTTGFLLLAAVYALSIVVPAWAAALIVSAGVGLIAAITLGLGMKKLKAMRGAPRTTATLKENAEWARQLTR
jgi:uncharacterized membrane protein YqjE